MSVDLAPATRCRSHSKKYPGTFGTEDRPAYSKTPSVHLEVLGGLHQALSIFRVLNRVSSSKMSIADEVFYNLTISLPLLSLQDFGQTSLPEVTVLDFEVISFFHQ